MISGTVYKIVDTRVPEVVLYVGSTETSLSERWRTHKYKSQSSTSKLYTYIREQGVEHFELVSLEHGFFKDTEALRQREEEYRVKLNPTLNSYKCKTDPVAYKRQFMRKYAPEHRTEKRAYDKAHYQLNRDRILKRQREPLTCDVCDGTTTRSGKSTHEKTQKHSAAVVAPFVRSRFGRAAFLAKLVKRN
jgi:hypothetical protein